MDQVDTKYIMLCDGDDFWLPGKIEDAVNGILEMERTNGGHIALLYHTDLTLVDHDLSPMSISMWKAQRLNPKRTQAVKCLMHNHAIGNTFIFNQALKQKALLRPNSLIMHDVFYLVIASLFGTVSYGKKSYMLYRQHENNICGGARFYKFTNLWNKLSPSNIREALRIKSELAAQILKIHSNEMISSDLVAFKDIASLQSASWFKKRIYIFKHRAFMNGILRNIGMFLFI